MKPPPWKYIMRGSLAAEGGGGFGRKRRREVLVVGLRGISFERAGSEEGVVAEGGTVGTT